MLQLTEASKPNAEYLAVPEQMLRLLPQNVLHLLINIRVVRHCHRTVTFLRVSSGIWSRVGVFTMECVIMGAQ